MSRSRSIARHRPPVWGERCYLMGVLNLTPDSFSDGGLYPDEKAAVARVRVMMEEGVDIIDLGAESTRPGAVAVPAAAEWQRLERVLPPVREVFAEGMVSVDTSKAEVAKAALAAGADWINDVWGFQGDPAMAGVVSAAGAGVVLMHNQRGTSYGEPVIDAVVRFLERSVALALEAGVSAEKVVIDPGIGFGKTPEQNLEVLSRLDRLRPLGFPILLGASRKSVIGKVLDLPVEDRLEGTLALSALGVWQGVDILRVHDVGANRRVARMVEAVRRRTIDG